MVTKRNPVYIGKLKCFVLAKKLMVTKRKKISEINGESFVLAKKLMVTKLAFNP